MAQPRSSVGRDDTASKCQDARIAVCGAIAFRRDGERIADPRIAFGGMAATPARARGAEQALAGAMATRESFEAAAAALAADFTPIDDFRATAAYRMRVAQNLVRRWFLAASGALPEAAE
jgi:xanthine dehydrogenase small subunit